MARPDVNRAIARSSMLWVFWPVLARVSVVVAKPVGSWMLPSSVPSRSRDPPSLTW